MINTSSLSEKIEQLKKKYESSGQDILAYLEGLLHTDYLNYWDYINLDTLLTLQKPLTTIPDEKIFILYHQITELYFQLVLHEMEQLKKMTELSEKIFLEKIRRMNRYFEQLIGSFDIMVDGMSLEQFREFRMALLPASGFQSVQYRLIEIHATELKNLIDQEHRNTLSSASLEEMYEHIYWKRGATELTTGKKTLTLSRFEEKYNTLLVQTAQNCQTKNLWYLFKYHIQTDELRNQLITALKQFDKVVNVKWPTMHLKSAVRYLQKNPDTIAATGGTNWQKYLPPRYQKRIFYPDLWTDAEKENWGKMEAEEMLSNS